MSTTTLKPSKSLTLKRRKIRRHKPVRYARRTALPEPDPDPDPTPTPIPGVGLDSDSEPDSGPDSDLASEPDWSRKFDFRVERLEAKLERATFNLNVERKRRKALEAELERLRSASVPVPAPAPVPVPVPAHPLVAVPSIPSDFRFDDPLDPAAARCLHERGVVVLKHDTDWASWFDYATFARDQREFVNPDENTVMVMGGFGAYGNPSSYHHPLARRLRSEFYAVGRRLMGSAFPDWYCEMLPDRYCVRRAGSSTSAESWHRDVTDPDAHDGAKANVYGGWVNLDTAPGAPDQVLTCCPGTHRTHAEMDARGFARLTKEESADFKKMAVAVRVPPGYGVVFNERVVHCVTARKQARDSHRLFMKYRVSREATPLFDWASTLRRTIIQDTFPLNVVQVKPPMYAKLHAVNWADRLAAFSDSFGPEAKELVSTPNGTTYRVRRTLHAIAQTGRPLFPAWTRDELEDLRMQRLTGEKPRCPKA